MHLSILNVLTVEFTHLQSAGIKTLEIIVTDIHSTKYKIELTTPNGKGDFNVLGMETEAE